MSEIEVTNGPFRFLVLCVSGHARSEECELITKGSFILTLKMAGIIPPFRLEFRMRKVVLGKRERSSGKSALEVLAEKCRSK